MQIAPARRAPLWQETLHQVILLTISDILEDAGASEARQMDALIPAIIGRYPSLKKVSCEAVFQRPGFVPNVRLLKPVYDIDGQWFDHTGWLQRKQLQQRAQAAFGGADPEIADQFSCWVDRKPCEQPLPPHDIKLARKAKKAFAGHMASLEAIAMEISTRGVAPTVKKRRPRL